MNIRICFVASGASVSTIDGKSFIRGVEIVEEYGEVWQSMFENATFFATSVQRALCEERMRNNDSDVSIEAYSLDQITEQSPFRVPITIRAGVMSILTGYDVKDISKADVASAAHSVYLLDLRVYILILMFLLILMVLIVCTSLMEVQRKRVHMEMNSIWPSSGQSSKMMKRRRIITQPGYTSKFALQQVSLFFRDVNTAPRSIILLVSFLSFTLVTFFMCFFSTKSIVVEKPTIFNSYEKLADSDNASVFFSGILPKSSDSFERAPKESVKGRIWARYITTPGSTVDNTEPTRIIGDYQLIRGKKYAMIATKSHIHIASWFACAFRGEKELRLLQITADASESEHVYGYAVSKYTKDNPYILRQLTRLFESSIVTHFIQSWKRFIYSSAPNRANLMQQQVACLGGVIDEPVEPPPVPITFWITASYAFACLILWSFLILLLEHCLCRYRFHSRSRL